MFARGPFVVLKKADFHFCVLPLGLSKNNGPGIPGYDLGIERPAGNPCLERLFGRFFIVFCRRSLNRQMSRRYQGDKGRGGNLC